MLYSKILNILPTFLQFALWAILIAYSIYLVYSTRKGKGNNVGNFTSMRNFAPLGVILLIHLIEKGIYFLFMIRIKNIENNFFLICMMILLLCFLGKKHGPLGFVAPIFLALATSFFFHFFSIFTAIVLAIIFIVVIFKKVKKCKEDKKFTDYLFWIAVILAWVLLQFAFGMMNALEIVLFAISLWYSIKDIGVKGILQWCIHVLIGLLMFCIIDWSFLHIVTVAVLYWILFYWIPQII